MAAPVRRTLGSKSKMRVIALSSKAAAENDMTKPSAISAGRALPVWPTDAPSKIGSIGSVQGAATVTTPASKARTRLNIEWSHETIPAGLVATADVSVVFRTQGEALPREASRVREALTGAKATMSRPQIQNDPEGGIPSGSLEVLWKVRRSVGHKIGVADCRCNSQVFPGDVANCFNCFVGVNYFAKPDSAFAPLNNQ